MSSLKKFFLVSCVAVAAFGVLQTAVQATTLLAEYPLHDTTLSNGSTCTDTGGSHSMTYTVVSTGSLTSVPGVASPTDLAEQFYNVQVWPNTGRAYASTTTSGLLLQQFPAGLGASVEAFFELQSLPTSEVAFYSEMASGGAPQLTLGIDGANHAMEFKVLNTAVGGTWETAEFNYSALPLQTNTWYYVAGTYNSSGTPSVYLYNTAGTLLGSGTVTPVAGTTLASTSTGSQIAMANQQYPGAGFACGYSGTLEDVGLYSGVLSASTMQAHASMTPTPEPSTLALLAAGLAGLLCYAWRKRR